MGLNEDVVRLKLPDGRTIEVQPLFSMVRTADGQQVFLIQMLPGHPSLCGIVMADCIRQFARAFADQGGYSYEEAVLQIKAGLDVEMSKPTGGGMDVVVVKEDPVPEQPYLDVSDWTDEDWAKVDANRGDMTREEFIQSIAAQFVADLQRGEHGKETSPNED